jgi:hypothetical protein
MKIYPTRHQAGNGNHHVLGPDQSSNGREWQIDADILGGASRVKISFEYDYGKKSVSWDIAEYRQAEMTNEGLTLAVPERKPIYSIVGSFNGWQIQDMVPSDKEDGLYEASFKLGFSGSADFQFMIDHDPSLIIYPDGCKVVQTSVPILGPAKVGADKSWLVIGLINEQVTVQLRIIESGVSLVLRSTTAGIRRWYSNQRWKEIESKYYLAGTFSDWALGKPMTETATAGVYETEVFLLRQGMEYFKVLINKDWKRPVSGCMIPFSFNGTNRFWCCLDSGGVQYAVESHNDEYVRIQLDMRNRPPELMIHINRSSIGVGAQMR